MQIRVKVADSTWSTVVPIVWPPMSSVLQSGCRVRAIAARSSPRERGAHIIEIRNAPFLDVAISINQPLRYTHEALVWDDGCWIQVVWFLLHVEVVAAFQHLALFRHPLKQAKKELRKAKPK